MSTLAPEAPPSAAIDTAEDEFMHITRPDDDNTALCGLDVSDQPWGDTLPICPACEVTAKAEGIRW